MPDSSEAIPTVPNIDLASVTGGADDARSDSNAEQPPLPTRRRDVCTYLRQDNPYLPQCPESRGMR